MKWMTSLSKFFKRRKKHEELKDKVIQVNEALQKINDGYNELVQLDIIKKKGNQRLLKNITAVAAVISVLFGYQQYLERNIESRIDNQEQILLFAVNSLESNSSAVRATGVKTLESVAFNYMLIEPKTGILSPIGNLYCWIINKREYLFLERTRAVFTDFAKNKRQNTNSEYNPVSTSLILVGLNWIEKEKQKFAKERTDPTLWFFNNADLSKANSPLKNFNNIWFSKVNFSNSMLRGCDFRNSYLEKAIFDGAILSSCRLDSANMKGTSLNSTKLNFASLNAVRGKGAIFQNSDLTNAVLDNSNFTQSNFENAILRTTSLRFCNFKSAVLREVDFMNADLEGVNFENCDLSGASFMYARNIDKIKSLKGANINNIKATKDELITLKIIQNEKN